MKKKASAKQSVYDHKKLEPKWQKIWEKKGAGRAKDFDKRPKFYGLIEFPYPSGEGLHVGHIRSNTAMDIIARKRRREGYNVLYPIGWDAFGLPTENYAIKTGIQPAIVTKKNTATFRRQLKSLGFSFDWSREIDTTDPKYYRWTQWIFLQFLKAGLAYKKKMTINWCPKDLIGLANEEVVNGCCERCGTPVEKREKEQWMLAITKYAERLLNDLDATNYKAPKVIDKVNPHQPGKPLVERHVAHAIVYDPKNKKYLIIRNKKHGWDTVIIGGIEAGETPEQTARREVQEETGYTDLVFKRILGGHTEAHYYTKHKGENRIAYAQAAYFELKSDKKVAIAPGEDKDNEILWIDPADFVPGKMVNSELPIWLERLKDPSKGQVKPLLDWKENIKELQRNWIGKSEGAQINFRIALKSRKIRFVLIHGYEGSPRDNFFPWLKKTLEARGHEVLVPELPNTNSPKESEQVDFVLKNCKLDENTVIVGHSLGAIVAMKAITKFNKPVSGLVVVSAAVDPKFDEGRDSTAYKKDFDWKLDFEKIEKLSSYRIAVLADTREPERLSYLKHLSKELDAALIETESRDEHFCGNEEPAILESVTPSVEVFTTRPDTLFGATYMVLSPEHHWVGPFLPLLTNQDEVTKYIADARKKTEIERTDEKKEKNGVELKGIMAVNPANNEEIPIWIADYVLADYGTGAIMAVPAHDERDWAFAKKYNIAIRKVIEGGTDDKPFTDVGKLINSGKFDGMSSTIAKNEITKSVGGEIVTKYKLRDWVFSRQRYWGEPIPVIHCPDCGIVPVPEKDLPVELPKVKNYKPTETGESPLAAIDKWVKVKCPKCKGPARRETDTMPNWAGSSWYYLRYTDRKNSKAFADAKKLKYWTPVDWYNGGMEHTTLHLLYSRFWHKFLYDQGLVPTVEPYTKRTSHGFILAENGEKMSKSRGNVINPDEVVKNVGADTLRVYEMFMGPFDQRIAWDTNNIAGSRRFIEKVWRLREKVSKNSKFDQKIIHKTIKKVGEDIEAMRFNTAISSLMILTNEMEKAESIDLKDYEKLLALVAPFAPHVAEELWQATGHKSSIHDTPWPKFDAKLISDEEATIIVQVNGKVRGSFQADKNTAQSELENTAKGLPDVAKWLEGKSVKKVIVVPGRLVSFVVV